MLAREGYLHTYRIFLFSPTAVGHLGEVRISPLKGEILEMAVQLCLHSLIILTSKNKAMTYEERLKYFCEQICHERLLNCGYINRNMIGDCTYLQDIMAGWEAGYQDAVDEAACQNDHCPKKLSCLRWQLGTNKDPHQIYLDESVCEEDFYIENKDW